MSRENPSWAQASQTLALVTEKGLSGPEFQGRWPLLERLLRREVDPAKIDLEAFENVLGLRSAPPAFVAKPPKVVKEHPLRKKFKTTAAALKAGAYPDGHDGYISDKTYPLRDGMQEDVDLVGLDVSESFDHDPTTTELLTLFAQHGYERPCYEDGLRDGAEHNSESYDRPFVYLHEPDAGGSVLCRGRWYDDRRLNRYFGRPDDHGDREHCVFFARRPPTAKP
ncbi:MAG: hypothetical protein Q7R62_01005 [bacterium]|nr:hypothetical protein [bacterium]